MRRAILILTLAGIVTVLALLYWFNPVETSLAPKCMFKTLTGWSCSGCGMQRFLHAFMHGRFREAIHYNYMLVVFIPYVTLFGIEQLVLGEEKRKQWKRVIENSKVAIGMGILVIAWVIVRNILHI